MTWWATPLLLSCYFWLSSYIKGFGVELRNLCLKHHCWKKKDEKKKLHMETTAFCQRLAMLSGCSWPSSLLNSDTSITLAPLSALHLQILSHSHKHYSFFPSFTQGLYSIRKKNLTIPKLSNNSSSRLRIYYKCPHKKKNVVEIYIIVVKIYYTCIKYPALV